MPEHGREDQYKTPVRGLRVGTASMMKFSWLRDLWQHTLSSLEAVLQQGRWSFALLPISLVVVWHVYVPIHELLHVAGCVLMGGTVNELALQPQYGVRLLQHMFPFIVIDEGGVYAGRLTGFATPNRWSYTVVDLFPYLPSVLGITLLEWARRRRSTLLFAAGFVLAYVPWISLTGDFYELASLATAPLAPIIVPNGTADHFISDDVFRLVGEMNARGMLTLGGIGLVALTQGLALGVVVALTALQWWVARRYGSMLLN